MSEHILKEHSELPNSVPCKQCSVKCPNKKILKEHIAKVHERDLFVCPECNKEFVRRSHVLRHMAQSGCNGKTVVLYPCEVSYNMYFLFILDLVYFMHIQYSCVVITMYMIIVIT